MQLAQLRELRPGSWCRARRAEAAAERTEAAERTGLRGGLLILLRLGGLLVLRSPFLLLATVHSTGNGGGGARHYCRPCDTSK